MEAKIRRSVQEGLTGFTRFAGFIAEKNESCKSYQQQKSLVYP
jgi:hypothetical protein